MTELKREDFSKKDWTTICKTFNVIDHEGWEPRSILIQDYAVAYYDVDDIRVAKKSQE